MTRAPGRLRALAFVPYPANTTPSQRFRIEQWAPLLVADGIDLEQAPFADDVLMEKLHTTGAVVGRSVGVLRGLWRQSVRAARARDYDVVLVHRTACVAGPAWLEGLLARRFPFVYDFDDALYELHTSDANRILGRLKFPGKTAALCRMSDVVVAGSEYLAQYARERNARVMVVPTSIDTELYQPIWRRDDPVVRIGWTGSATSMTHLEAFSGVLRRLTELRTVEIRVQSNRPPRLLDVPHLFRPWSPATEVEEIQAFDIGIKPMPDDPWTRGKCPMKELQYMAVGIPTVASALGSAVEAISAGENGFLASTPDEWLHHLTRLVDDRALRTRIGAAARRTVEERYSARTCASRFAGALREAVEQRRRRVAQVGTYG